MGQQQTARQLKKEVYIIENLDCANCAASVGTPAECDAGN